MNLAEIRALVQSGAHNRPLPRGSVVNRLILSLTISTCCRDTEMLVLSRVGGFVSRDCLNCGLRSSYLRLAQIPDLDCADCLRFNRLGTVEPLLKERNYWYRCTGCRREWKIADIVPPWSEALGYAGLAAPGDPALFA